MKYEKAVAAIVEFDNSDVVTASTNVIPCNYTDTKVDDSVSSFVTCDGGSGWCSNDTAMAKGQCRCIFSAGTGKL